MLTNRGCSFCCFPLVLISDSQSDVVHVHENHKRKSNPKESVNLKRKCSDERYEKRQERPFLILLKLQNRVNFASRNYCGY